MTVNVIGKQGGDIQARRSSTALTPFPCSSLKVTKITEKDDATSGLGSGRDVCARVRVPMSIIKNAPFLSLWGCVVSICVEVNTRRLAQCLAF